MKLKDRFFIYDTADRHYGFTFVERPGDHWYLDIKLGFKFIMIVLKKAKAYKNVTN